VRRGVMRSRTGIPIAVLTGLGVVSLSNPAASQGQLPGVYVQGATLETRRPSSGKGASSETAPPPEAANDAGGVPLEQIGTAVTVVTGAQLQAQQIRHAADALRSLPGVAVSRTGSSAG